MNLLPSKLVENAVNEVAKLPGIGRKTALRLVLHLLKENPTEAESLGQSIIKMRNEVNYCKHCHNISDTDTCEICANMKRNKSIICVVKDVRDVIAVENTGYYSGVYHILGGIISPMEGIGPDELNIKTLVDKVASGDVSEVIMALSSTIEGDTTVFYIYKQIKKFNIRVSVIARGISIGDELEYADEVTLGRSISNRVAYEDTLSK